MARAVRAVRMRRISFKVLKLKAFRLISQLALIGVQFYMQYLEYRNLDVLFIVSALSDTFIIA